MTFFNNCRTPYIYIYIYIYILNINTKIFKPKLINYLTTWLIKYSML